MLTKKIEYGYIILKKLKDTNETLLMSGKEILNNSNIPYSMGLSILTNLSQGKLIFSNKGKNGGFYLNQEKKITFLDLFVVLEYKLSQQIDKRNIYIDDDYELLTTKLGNIVLEEMKNIKIEFNQLI